MLPSRVSLRSFPGKFAIESSLHAQQLNTFSVYTFNVSQIIEQHKEEGEARGRRWQAIQKRGAKWNKLFTVRRALSANLVITVVSFYYHGHKWQQRAFALSLSRGGTDYDECNKQLSHNGGFVGENCGRRSAKRFPRLIFPSRSFPLFFTVDDDQHFFAVHNF